MTRFSDKLTPCVDVLLTLEALHEFGSKPAWITVELMFAKSVSRDEMYVVTLIGEPEGDLTGRNSATQDEHRLLVGRPAVEIRRESDGKTHEQRGQFG